MLLQEVSRAGTGVWAGRGSRQRANCRNRAMLPLLRDPEHPKPACPPWRAGMCLPSQDQGPAAASLPSYHPFCILLQTQLKASSTCTCLKVFSKEVAPLSMNWIFVQGNVHGALWGLPHHSLPPCSLGLMGPTEIPPVQHDPEQPWAVQGPVTLSSATQRRPSSRRGRAGRQRRPRAAVWGRTG